MRVSVAEDLKGLFSFRWGEIGVATAGLGAEELGRRPAGA